MCFSFSDAFSVDIFSTRARCIKRYSNNGPLAAGMRRRRGNIFGDLSIFLFTSTTPSFDMCPRVFENILSSGSKRNENAALIFGKIPKTFGQNLAKIQQHRGKNCEILVKKN